MTVYSWLPQPLNFIDYGSNQGRITAAAYAIFKNDFIDSSPECFGKKVIPNPNLMPDGSEECFWHLISQEHRNNRVFMVNRCERINWPRSIIENIDHQDVISWKTRHKGKKSGKKDWRLKIALRDFSYIIILREQSKYYVLITAYPVDYPHNIMTLYYEYQNANNFT